jgi:hypothetical protein
VRAVTLAAAPARAFITRTASSPALSKKVPTKHRASLHREGSGDREDGAIRDGGGHLHERKQEKGMSRATKRGPNAPKGAGWAL